ncbi:MAG TPA: SGNH/GDSL hydrolase family protein [Motilibacterales bacterium]|nr:SGNH/GDSL hydrolase family protein [Motilibacterales bacterium]
MARLVCLGDSFTEGMVDVRRPDGHFTGWADRVALGLAQTAQRSGSGPVEYANLAVRGKLLDQVVDEQLEVALAMQPDVVTFHAGPNDVLRTGTDFDDLVRRYESAVRRLSDEVDRVVLFTSLTRAGGTGRLADRLEARFIRFNESVRQVADRQGCLLVDDEAVTALADRRFWGVDRLHLNELGHARVAANVLATLGVTDAEVLGGPVGWWGEPLPPSHPISRRDAVAADLQWARVHLGPWVVRRVRGISSGDGRSAKDPHLRRVAP